MKRKPVAILLAVLLVAVTCSVAFSSVFAETGENLFYNGDFTQHNGTTPEGWAIENANRYYSSTVSNTVVTPTGANTVVFTAKAAATGTFTTLYNTRSIQIQKNTKYTISYYIKDKNIPGLRFFLYEPDGLDRHGNAFHYEGPVNGRNIYSYYWDDGANTRIVRTEIKNDIVVENTGYKLRDSANIYANSMAYVEGTVNGSTQQLILTGDFDGTANGQKGTDQWVKIVHTFTTGNKNSHEALVRYGISVPGFAGGQVAVGGFTMLAEPVDVTLTPKVNNADLGYTAPATLSVGSKANFYAYALPGNEFTGWYESSAPNAKLLTNSPFYVFECTAGNASAALNYEARFSAGAGAVPAAGFENGYTAKQMLVRFNSAKPGTYLNKHENWACASDSALTWQQISVNSSVSHGGSHSVELNTRYSHAGYLVPVTLKPNTNYVLSFYGLDENIGNILNVRVLPYNQTPYVKDAQGNLKINTATLGTTASPVSATGTWTETTVQFNTGSNTKVSVWFNFAGPAGVMYVDDISIFEPVSVGVEFEPGGTAMVSRSGLAAKNSQVIFVAQPNSGNTFAGWYEKSGGTLVSANPVLAVTATGPLRYVAHFNGYNKPPRDVLAATGNDGTFESGTVSGWSASYEGQQSFWSYFTPSNEQAYEGFKSLKLHARNQDVVLPLNSLRKNTDYVLSFYFLLPRYDEETKITSVGVTGSSDISLVTSSSVLASAGNIAAGRGWQKQSLYFNTGDTDHGSFILSYHSNYIAAYMYLDNLFLTEYTPNQTLENGSLEQSTTSWLGDLTPNTAEKAAQLNKAGQTGYQVVAVEPASAYTVTFRAKGRLLAAATELEFENPSVKNALSSLSFVKTSAESFQTYSYTFYSGPHQAVRLAFTALGNNALFGGVTLTKAQEPYGTVVEKVDFETERFALKHAVSAWQLYTGAAGNQNVHSGTSSLRFVADAAGAGAAAFNEAFLSQQLVQGVAYRISLWYKAAGAGAGSFAFAPDYTAQYNYGAVTAHSLSQGWQQASFSFVATGDLCVKPLLSSIAGQTKGDFYIDDITVEVSTPIVIEKNVKSSYCEELYSAVENGSFEYAVKNQNWANLPGTATVVSGNALSGKQSLRVTAGTKYFLQIPVEKSAEYIFGASLRANAAVSGYVGLMLGQDISKKTDWFCDAAGNTASKIQLTDFSGKWQRGAFRFASSNSGFVNLVIVVTSGTLELDSVQLFRSDKAYESDPNNYTVYKNYNFEATDSNTCVINGGFGPQPYYKKSK